MSIQESMGEAVVYASRWRLALVAIGALGFVLACIWLWEQLGLIEPHLILVMLGGVLFFGAGFVYAMYRCIFLPASLVLNLMGFRDNASLLGAGHVQWNEVKRITVRVFTNQRFLCVDPVDPEIILMRHSQLKRKFMRMNIGFTGTPITIPLNTFRESEKELLDLFRQYSAGRFPVLGMEEP